MLQLEQVCFKYPSGTVALENISFRGAAGELLLILGHNGAGKSTLLKLLNGIQKPVSGKVMISGLDTREHTTADLARKVAVTFQNPGDQIFASTVEREVAFGPESLKRLDSMALVESSLRLFNLEKQRTMHPYDLPPSQRKLVTIASAAAMGSSLLAFDEPSAGLSIPERNILAQGFRKLAEHADRLLLVVSHDLDLFLPLASRVLMLDRGSLVFYGMPGLILEQPSILRTYRLKLPLSMRLKQLLAHTA
ncbi:MAG: energy-coupling factor ABC transporter ATP-binding protein [Bacteroidota bacterium]